MSPGRRLILFLQALLLAVTLRTLLRLNLHEMVYPFHVLSRKPIVLSATVYLYRPLLIIYYEPDAPTVANLAGRFDFSWTISGIYLGSVIGTSPITVPVAGL